jgi:hypothetical protein
MTAEIGAVTCGSCGAPITGEPPISEDLNQRTPCPQCGSRARTVGLTVTSTIAIRSTATATVIHYSEALLAKAQDLIARGEFSIAVVVAHMACEIAVERAISRAFAARGIEYLKDPVFDLLQGYNLANERIRNLYNAVTETEIQRQPFWQAFKESATRRNKSVHKGAPVTRAEADNSYNAARDLVAQLMPP